MSRKYRILTKKRLYYKIIKDRGERMAELFLRGRKVEIQRYDILESTNSFLKMKCKEGAGHYYTVIADRQSGGRGRLGRSFFSDGGGLYMSFLLKDVDEPDIIGVTAATGVSVSEAIESVCGVKCGIKWVNDLIFNGLKVCGILAEGVISDDGKINGVVVGIGVNISPPAGGFPNEIKDIAGSISDSFSYETRNTLAIEILRSFDSNFRSRSLPEKYRKLSTVIGADIKVISPDSTYYAAVDGIDDSFGLMITDENGVKKTLRSGEISIRMK